MAKMKIFELKNEINNVTKGALESKDILDFLERSFGVKKTHSSNLEDNEVAYIKNYFVQASKSSSASAGKPAAAPAARPVQATSVKPSNETVQKPVMQQGTNMQSAQTGINTTGSSQNNASTGNVRPAVQSSNRPTTTGEQMSQSGSRSFNGQNPARPVQTGQTGNQMNQRPASGQSGVRQGQTGQYNGQRSFEQGHQGTPGQRPAGGQGVVRQGQQEYQGQQNRSSSYEGRQSNDVKSTDASGYQNNNTSRATTDQGQNNNYGQRPANRANSENRPYSEGYQARQQQNRPYGEGYQGQRPQNRDGYQGQRSQNRPTGDNRPSNDQRPSGEGRPTGDGYQNQRNSGQGYQGQRQGRPGEGRPSYDNRPAGGSGYQGNRPAGGSGYQGNRPAGGSGYQGNRPAGGSGYQGNRPAGGSGYQGNRPAGEGYQGNRPAGASGYQGNRTSGDNRPSYDGQGNRGQGGARPGYQGGQQNRGGFGGQGNYSRPSGGQRPGGGYAPRGFDETNKDDDDKPSYGNRSSQGAKKGTGRVGERKNFDQQILDQKVAEKNDNSNKRNRDRINKEKNYKEKSLIDRDEDHDDIKVKIAPKKGQFIQPKPIQVVEEEIKVIQIPEVLTIKELAEKMKKPSAALIKKLFLGGKIVTLNQEITFEEAEEIALGYDIIAEKEVKVNVIEELLKEQEEDPDTMEKRPPVVCVMGHVDHGKTSLLDAIRETNVTSREAGGITQHIGAYVVEINGEKITFLDTPGHEAFTSMRKRGAKSTDIAILVVAADDGVMPQTVEAINHAKAAGVQIIVAINKIDKPSANIERVKQELTEYELIAEDWGGDTIFVPVSAHTKEGIDQLLEMIILTSELLELKANPDRNARGIVIEAELDKGRGPVATILVQKGTLHVGDNVAVGASFGKVRAMMDDKGRRVKEATPSTPVEILGLNEVPDAGETFLATVNEKEARTIAEAYLAQSKEKLIADTKAKLSLDGLFSQIKAGNIKELNLIIKADVQGSVEAMKQSLLKLSNDEVAIRFLHGGVGAINESDVILASTSNAIIIGFNVRPDNAAKETADREKVDVKLYRVIYDAINDIEAAMKGMLDPIFEEKIIGHAEIRMTFKASGVGTIAGSYVLDGKIIRGCKARVFRDNAMIYEGILASLKRFQDDVKEVATGYECGLVFEKFNDVKEGDKVELYIMAEVPR